VKERSVTLELTEQEQTVLTYLFALGGVVCFGESHEAVRKHVETAQNAKFPPWWDAAEGSLQRKVLATERTLGRLGERALAELDRKREIAWPSE